MESVKGTIRNGVALPLEPVAESDEGRSVIITFVDEPVETSPQTNGEHLSLDEIIERFKVDTGIPDLAAQHDHYLYGTPKR
jgi:hypothetical protein